MVLATRIIFFFLPLFCRYFYFCRNVSYSRLEFSLTCHSNHSPTNSRTQSPTLTIQSLNQSINHSRIVFVRSRVFCSMILANSHFLCSRYSIIYVFLLFLLPSLCLLHRQQRYTHDSGCPLPCDSSHSYSSPSCASISSCMCTHPQALWTALRRNMLACPDLGQLDPLLARHRLTDLETGQVVLAALKVELSQVCSRAFFFLWLNKTIRKNK